MYVCTVVLAWNVFADAPLVVAANRTESLERPSRPPRLVGADPAVVAPRDERAGGTWIGYNEHRLFTTITNRTTDVELAGERSRGLLTRDVLDCRTVEQATQVVKRETESDEYEGFNLVIADTTDAILVEWDGELNVRELSPGVHITVNVGKTNDFTIPETHSDMGNAQARNARRALQRLDVRSDETSGQWRERAVEVLQDHEHGLCIHSYTFGTTSSSVVTLSDSGNVEFLFADGSPCQHEYEEYSLL